MRTVCIARSRKSFTDTDFYCLVQITAWVDEGLDEKRYIVPGLGDFGDRSVVIESALWATLIDVLRIIAGTF